MLTQGYKGSSISIASLQEVMSIHLLNPCSTQTNKGNHNCFFLLSFPLPSFKGLLPRRPTHFYVCFTAGSMELVSWRGFLFSPVLYNEAWIFVLGSSPLIMTRKKKMRDCYFIHCFIYQFSIDKDISSFYLPTFLFSNLSKIFSNFTSISLWITRKFWILLKDDPFAIAIISRELI